jgi:hypothetical protein
MKCLAVTLTLQFYEKSQKTAVGKVPKNWFDYVKIANFLKVEELLKTIEMQN